MKSGVNVEIGSPVTVDVKVPARSVDKLVDAATDTFSPASEVMGLLGDVVRLARVEVAAAITRRAKAIAEENGMTLNVPPLKFLVPFYEKASTEDGSDENLVEMWARLLSSAGSNYMSRHMKFTSILSELSAEQAKILDGIARNFGGVIFDDTDPDETIFSLAGTRLSSSLKSLKSKDFDGLIDEVARKLFVPGVSVVMIYIELKADRGICDWSGDDVYTDEKSLDFDILKSMGLLTRVETDFIDCEHAEISVIYYYLSELGYNFWSACCEGQPVEAPAQL